LIAQSGAVCAAMLDFAASVRIGFSTVVEGRRRDRSRFRRAARLRWSSIPTPTGILLYAEAIGDARRFMSALRAAARTKPVVGAARGKVAWTCCPQMRQRPTPSSTLR
jgi:acetyltransferase